MSTIETAKKQLEEKTVADIAHVAALRGARAPEKPLLLRMAKKDAVAPAAAPVAPQPVDTVAMQNYVNGLSPEGLKVLSDLVKKRLEAKDSPLQPGAPQPPQRV